MAFTEILPQSRCRRRCWLASSYLLLGITACVYGTAAGFMLGTACGHAARALFGIAAGPSIGASAGIAFAISFGFGLGMVGTAWSRFQVSSMLLALRRRLPWRLMGFLEDAHAQGVLRQAGVVYQFRHLELQHRLDSGPPGLLRSSRNRFAARRTRLLLSLDLKPATRHLPLTGTAALTGGGHHKQSPLRKADVRIADYEPLWVRTRRGFGAARRLSVLAPDGRHRRAGKPVGSLSLAGGNRLLR